MNEQPEKQNGLDDFEEARDQLLEILATQSKVIFDELTIKVKSSRIIRSDKPVRLDW